MHTAAATSTPRTVADDYTEQATALRRQAAGPVTVTHRAWLLGEAARYDALAVRRR